uniref:Uncharacterized protein n=1 Tax=Rhizophora mucronata TaxID=61149 RepID=A0A2P2PTN1_RHIMU
MGEGFGINACYKINKA